MPKKFIEVIIDSLKLIFQLYLKTISVERFHNRVKV